MTSTHDVHDRWTHRLGVAALLCAVPLVLFGGSVTTLGAGMAVEGWLIAEGHFLLLFPVESWLRDTPTFVEHTHRLFGALVGVLAIGAVWAARRARKQGRVASIAMPVIALVAVCLQGTLGGYRVILDSLDLAFLHGVFAQATFALLAVAMAVAAKPWADARQDAAAIPARVAKLALVTTLVVFGQVAIGAWYRHGLRPEPVPGSEMRLALHFAGAAASFVTIAVLAAALKRAAATAGAADVLTRYARRLHILLGLQILLGLAAWAGFRPGVIGPAEWGLSILHVLTGALLLSQCAMSLAWARHLRGARSHAAGQPVSRGGQVSLGGAR